jgi:hypothetical protein
MSCRFVALVSLCVTTAGWAAEPAKPQGPLADLPSKPGAHVDKIKDLGNNEWLELDAPAADPKWGHLQGETGAWDKEPLPLPEKLKRLRGCGHGFYSPELNAHFLYKAEDSEDRGTMWVYRYKDAR